MSIEVEAYEQADRLMADWMKVWLRAQEDDGAYHMEYWEFMELAANRVARGLDYGSSAEEVFERHHAIAHGDVPEARWGAVDEARYERAWSYVLDTPEEVLVLLAERGQVVKVS